jgi:internalin A
MRQALACGLVVLTAVLLGPVGLRADEAAALAWVAKHGGTVTRAEKKPGRPVVGVDLRFRKVTDAELKELAHFDALQTLDLRRTKVTNAGLKELAKLKALHTLDLSRTQVTDAGLNELANLKSLRVLYLYHTHVTAAGVAELRKALPKCSIYHG